MILIIILLLILLCVSISDLYFTCFIFYLNNRKDNGSGDVEAYYQEREERFRKLHDEEIKEAQDRFLHVKERAKADLEEYQEDIQFERQRRITELQRQHEEHQEVIEALKVEYTTNLQKMKEFSILDTNATNDAQETMR